MTLKDDAKFEEKLICCFKNNKNLVNFDLSTEVGKIFTLISPFNVWPKKYRGVIFHDTEESCKIWRNKNLCFGKWHKEFGNFSPEHSKLSKLRLSLASFTQKKKIYEFKTYRGVMCYDNEEWCKIWKGIDFSVQNWYEELNTFWPAHSKIPKICILMGGFWPKYIMFELRTYKRVMFGGTQEKFEGKLTTASKIDMRNLTNFDQSTWKSQNWDCDGMLLSRVENAWA